MNQNDAGSTDTESNDTESDDTESDDTESDDTVQMILIRTGRTPAGAFFPGALQHRWVRYAGINLFRIEHFVGLRKLEVDSAVCAEPVC